MHTIDEHGAIESIPIFYQIIQSNLMRPLKGAEYLTQKFKMNYDCYCPIPAGVQPDFQPPDNLDHGNAISCPRMQTGYHTDVLNSGKAILCSMNGSLHLRKINGPVASNLRQFKQKTSF